MELTWRCLSFNELTNLELYRLLQLRTEVFVVEQQCAYAELDGLDTAPDTYHLLGERQGELCAYARLLAPGLCYSTASLGRVICAPHIRGHQCGHQLIRRALEQIATYWPNSAVTIGAQAHLTGFYQQHGFVAVSAPYMEDGIAHIKMQRLA